MSSSLDPDQDRYSVGPDLGPNCLQRLTADDLSQFLFDISFKQLHKWINRFFSHYKKFILSLCTVKPV